MQFSGTAVYLRALDLEILCERSLSFLTERLVLQMFKVRSWCLASLDESGIGIYGIYGI